jgi:guanylate kinase
MPEEPINFDVYHTKSLVVVISGPSGVGKDAVLQSLKARQSPFYFVVTTTSRPMRSMEKEGVDYHFVSKGEFERMMRDGEFLEYAVVYKDYKGVPKAEVEKGLASNKDVILRLDVQGAAKIRSLFPQDSVLIFLLPTSEEEWYERLERRGTETKETLKVRRDTAIQEMGRLNEFDYVVINAEDRLNHTVDEILEIIRVEHHRINSRNITL